jgi:hypothetical protein
VVLLLPREERRKERLNAGGPGEDKASVSDVKGPGMMGVGGTLGP